MTDATRDYAIMVCVMWALVLAFAMWQRDAEVEASRHPVPVREIDHESWCRLCRGEE